MKIKEKLKTLNDNEKIEGDIIELENKKIDTKQIKNNAIKILKLFIIFNLINIMQFFTVSDEYVINIFKLSYIKKISFYEYMIAMDRALNLTYWISFAILFLTYKIIYSIISKKKISLFIITCSTYIVSLINYLVTDIRGSAVTLCDILSIRTALDVSNAIEINFNNNMIIASILFIVTLILILFFYRRKDEIIEKKQRLLASVISVIVLVLIMNSNTIKNISIWNLDYVYSDYGVPITLVKLSTNIFVKKPKEYNKNEVEELLKQYEDDEVANSEENINIVVVMNESFTDYNNCEYINMLQDNIPYFHELQNQENVISGNLHSDAFGGRTANIEYEFLTQNSVAYLPTGSIVYQQYLTKKVDSIVRNMNKMNYTTYGIHTWNKTCYRRNAVYPLLGFDYYFFKEDYDDLKEGLNDYVLDISSYRKIMEIFDNKNEGEKIFSFNVTVQNHKPYDRYDYTEIDYIENKESEINIYLQTEHKSDEALKELIEYFENYNERIILLFFGDHQPNTDIEQIGDDEEYKYQIPYLIWANYDINENQYGDTSTNYLQSILMETAGLPLDSYTNYIIELRKQIPVLTANYYIGNNGIKYLLDDKESPYYEKIKEYEKVVYYKMFDEKVAY